MNRPLLIISLTLLGLLILSVLSLPGFASFDKKISQYYLRNSLEETDASNVVGSIVWDYRAFDTLGEETVLFVATLGIYTLFKRLHEKFGGKAK